METEREREIGEEGQIGESCMVVDSVPCVEHPTRERESGWARVA